MAKGTRSTRKDLENKERGNRAVKIHLVTDEDSFAAAGVCPKQYFQNTATKHKTLNELTGGEGAHLLLLL